MLGVVDPGLADDIEWQAPIEDRSRNPRDVVTHVHAWHLMVADWCRKGDVGDTPEVPGGGYTWREIPAVNDVIWERFRSTSYDAARQLLATSHHDVMGLIEEHTNEQLFGRGVYAWTRSSTLGSYFVSCTSSHYVWARKTLRAILKSG
jgi:hypothetical protein